MMMSNISHNNTKRRMRSAILTRDCEDKDEWSNVYQWDRSGVNGCDEDEDMYGGHDSGNVDDDDIEHDDDDDDEGVNRQHDACCSSSTVPSLSRTSCDSSSVCSSSIATVGVGTSKYATIRYDEKLIGLHTDIPEEQHERSLRRTIYEGEYNERVLLQESYRFRREKVIRQREQQLRLLEERERGRNRRVMTPSLPEEIAVVDTTCNSAFMECSDDGSSTVFERTFIRYYRRNDGHGGVDNDDDGFILGMELLMTTLVILVVVVAIILGLNGPSDD